MAHMTDKPYINNGNIPVYLDKLAEMLLERYKTTVGRIKILIVGGSALALKYNFRTTVDIDTDIQFRHSLKGSIDNVAKFYNIPTDWINQDFRKSISYSKRLWDNAVPVSILRDFMEIYVVSDLDQLCMKIVAGRQKDDRDIVFLTAKLVSDGCNYDMFVQRYKYLYSESIVPNKSTLNEVRKMFTSSVYLKTMLFMYRLRV